MGSAPRQVGAAKTVVNKAYDDGLVSAETVQVFKRVKKLLKRNSNARDTVLTIEQIESLMGALPHHTKTIMATAFYTGMRRGEILSLTWDKVNLEKKVIRLEAGDTKDREPRTIPISKELFPILAAIPRALHDNHVFLYKGKPVRDIRTGLIVACKTAGIPYGRFTKNGFVFHDLRHTFNTYMRKAGVAESVIMEITGHSTREMFDRYNTIDHDDRRQAVDRMSTFLTNFLNGRGENESEWLDLQILTKVLTKRPFRQQKRTLTLTRILCISGGLPKRGLEPRQAYAH